MKWQANWIWLKERTREDYVYAHARKVFDIKGKCNDAVIHISANNIYRLYVNGEFVEQGPDRSDPKYPYYDTHDISYYLKKGKNVIALDLYCITRQLNHKDDPQRYWALYGGEPGFLCEVHYKDGKSRKRVKTDSSWKMIKSPCWKSGAKSISRFLGYVEHIDANAVAAFGDYKKISYNDSTWETPVLLGIPPKGKLGCPIPKESAYLKRVKHRPLGAGSFQQGDKHITNENYQLGAVPEMPSAVTTPEGGAPSVMTYDFGRTMGGGIEVEFENCSGGRAEIYYGDAQRRQLYEIIELPKKGKFRFQSFDWRGTRYAAIMFYNIKKKLIIRSVRFIERQYPFEYEADFEADNEKFGRIWRMCKTTAHVAAKDHLQDCVTREQALWIEDVLIHTQSLIACFGDTVAAKKAVRQALRAMTKQGNIAVPGPGFAGYGFDDKPPRWGGQSFVIPIILEHLYKYDADKSFLKECAPKINRLLDYMALHSDKSGLLDGDKKGAPGIQIFTGWTGMQKVGKSTTLNTMYALALKSTIYVMEKIGRKKDAEKYSNQHKKLSSSLMKNFFSEKDGLLFDGERNGKLNIHFAPTYNATAVLAGVIPANKWAAWADAMENHPQISTIRSPYDASMVTEAYYKIGRPDLAEKLVERCWGTFADLNSPTVPEMWGADNASTLVYDSQCQSSYCHPYGTGPAYLFQRNVLGAKITREGCREIEISPLVSGVKLARGRFNTPEGEVEIYWRRNKIEWYMEVMLPEGISATVILPRYGWGAGRMTCDKKVIWEDNGWRRFTDNAHRRKHSDVVREVCTKINTSGRHVIKMEVI